MNARFILLVLIALVCASVAALIAKSWISRKTEQQAVATSSVVVAASEIPFGVKLEAVHLKTIPWPSADVPEGSHQKVDDVVGKIVKNSFYKGEVITDKRIAEHLGGSMLASLVAENFRAVSIRVDDVVGVAGFVLPGNRVDVLSTRILEGGVAREADTTTILENIKVLAVDQEASPDKEKPAIVRAVTLELTPEQAEVITEAMQEGKIQLSLRNPLDTAPHMRKPQAVQAPPPLKPVVAPPARAKPSLVLVPW